MVAYAGPLATRCCEPRQARKGAAAAVTPGAGEWLARATLFPLEMIMRLNRACLFG